MARLGATAAVVMLVALGGSHGLLHLDEPAHAHADLHAAKGEPAPASDRETPLHGCGAHCASAHIANQPPAPEPVAAPGTLQAAWSPAAQRLAEGRPPERDLRPPRA